MLKKRIVAAIDMANGQAVKSVNFVNPAVVGDPYELAQKYAAQGADEIVFLDILAYHEQRENTYALMRRAAEGLTIPVTIAGGIRTTADFEKALACGASKVSIASAAAVDPSLITQVSQAFGSDKVVIAIDAKKVGGDYHVFIKGGREYTGLDLVDWAKQCEQLGAGEIVVNSMDGDGTKNGYDIAMTQAVTEAVSLPVVASGGCGRVSHVIDVFEKTGCQSALVASLLHYGIATITDIKNEMRKHGWQTL